MQFDYVTVRGHLIRSCYDFAKKIYNKNAVSPRDFGSDSIRDATDSISDMVEGKIAELAFAQMVHANTALSPEANFNIYDDPGITDGGSDLPQVRTNNQSLALRLSIDVKSTRARSHWLLVDNFRFHSDVFVIVKVDLPDDIESNSNHWPELFRWGVRCKVIGFAYRHDFLTTQTGDPKYPFKKGERLFNPNTGDLIGPPLKSRLNYGLPIGSLRKDTYEWFELFRWIKSSVFYGEAI